MEQSHHSDDLALVAVEPEAVPEVAIDDAAPIPDEAEKVDAGENTLLTGDDVATVEPEAEEAIADDPKPITKFSDGLTGAALAQRLGRDAGSITKHHQKGDLPQWSKELDPAGISWERRGKLYYPVSDAE